MRPSRTGRRRQYRCVGEKYDAGQISRSEGSGRNQKGSLPCPCTYHIYVHWIVFIAKLLTAVVDTRIIYDMIHDIFVNCNWVDTRWQ
jgi:hypothetical protein